MKPTKIKDNHNEPLQDKSGIGFIEIVVGVGLFAVALFGMLTVMGDSLSMGEFSKHRVMAMNDARRVLEEIRKEIEANGPTGVAGISDWNAYIKANLSNPSLFELTNENITVTTSNPTSLPLQVQVLITWDERGKQSNYQVESLITNRGS